MYQRNNYWGLYHKQLLKYNLLKKIDFLVKIMNQTDTTNRYLFS
jgi:hypothetical protein